MQAPDAASSPTYTCPVRKRPRDIFVLVTSDVPPASGNAPAIKLLLGSTTNRRRVAERLTANKLPCMLAASANRQQLEDENKK
jgi:hypothetical protein